LRAKSKKKILGRGIPQWGGGHPSPHPNPLGALILVLTALNLGALSALLAMYTHLYF